MAREFEAEQLNLNAVSAKLLKNPIHSFSLGFGSGLLPFAPGTWGTIMALPFYFIMLQFSSAYYLFMLAILTVASVFACDYTSKE